MKGIAFWTSLAMATGAVVAWPEAKHHAIKYSTVEGYFLQDEAATNPSNFDYADHNFGLLNRAYPTDHKFDPEGKKTQWERFAHWVHYINGKCHKDAKETYKVLFFGRHGEGYHNVAESYYGTPAWNCYWSELTGNGTIVWEDASLTPAGFKEAEKASAYYTSRFEQEGLPYFQSYYVSPLYRCLLTANTTFSTIKLPRHQPFVPTIKELFREGISEHTCDHRSKKSWIHEKFPSFRFEHGFAEDDELWHAGQSETSAHQLARSQRVLDDVFTHDKSTWISVTSHSGEIASLLQVLGHRVFGLGTGQIIPVLIKAELVEPTATTSVVGFTPGPTCNAPPVTSIPGQGCVCSETATATATSSTATPTE